MIAGILTSFLMFYNSGEPVVKIILKAEKRDFVTVYYSDSKVNYGRVPSSGLFVGSKRFELKGSNQYDTLITRLNAIEDIQSLAIRLGENHKDYGKRLKLNNINISSITIQDHTHDLEITKDNFLDYFDWNVYVDSIGLGDQIDIYSKQWYYNIHPYIFLDTYLDIPKPNDSYIELDFKNKNFDIFSVSYLSETSDSVTFDYFKKTKVIVEPSNEFRILRIPIYSNEVIRKLKIRLGYFGKNEFYIKSIKIKSLNKSIKYSYKEIPLFFKFNQFYYNKMPDILSYKLGTDISGNVYYPTVTIKEPIRYQNELILDKLILFLGYLIVSIILLIVTKKLFSNQKYPFLNEMKVQSS